MEVAVDLGLGGAGLLGDLSDAEIRTNRSIARKAASTISPRTFLRCSRQRSLRASTFTAGLARREEAEAGEF